MVTVTETPSCPVIGIEADRVLTHVTGIVHEPGFVLVADGIITAVGPGRVPADFGEIEVMRLPGGTVLPGMIDSHAHVLDDWPGDTAPTAGDFDRDRIDQNHLERGLSRLRDAAMRGVTTVRDMGSATPLVYAIAAASQRDDWTGARLVCVGPALCPPGGHSAGTLAVTVSSAADVRREVASASANGARAIKVMATGGIGMRTGSGETEMIDGLIRAAVTVAADHGLPVHAHAHGADGILRALRAGVAGIEHGVRADRTCIAAFRESGAFLTPTLSVYRAMAQADVPGRPPEWRSQLQSIVDAHRACVEDAVRAGVGVLVGSDSGSAVHPVGSLVAEAKALVDCGMSPLQVLSAMTVGNAAACGVGHRAGSIEAGKDADLIGVTGDPRRGLDPLEDMSMVMVRGHIVRRPAPSVSSTSVDRSIA